MGAIARYKSAAGGVDLRFGVVTFPLDARHPADLRSLGMTRHEAARRGAYGDVVETGKLFDNHAGGEEQR